MDNDEPVPDIAERAKKRREARSRARREQLERLPQARAELAQKQEEQREQRSQRISAWLTAHWKDGRRCPYCESDNWSYDPDPFMLTRATDTDKGVWGYGVRCETCGNVVLLSAEVMGLESESFE